MKNILVTGAAGFIGTNFVYYWLDRYPEDRITGLDALTYAGNRANLEKADKNPNFRFVHASILDQDLVETLIETENIDTIVHFAAESHVDRSILGPDQFIQTNITGTHTLLKAARKIWLDRKNTDHRFHHISTDEVYGSLGPDDPAFTEKNQYQPNSPYAASKAASDHLVRAYHKTYGLETTITNCSNNYGPFQFPEKLIPLVIINILNNKPLPVYGDGRQIRDWLYVDDHNLGVDLVLHKGEPGRTYNIGGNNEKANIDIIRQICRFIHEIILENPELARAFPLSPASQGTDPEDLITHVKDRPGHDRRYAINADRITDELGFCPRHSFETGIKKTIKWYLENRAWWQSVMAGTYRDWLRANYKTRK